ncbi:hyaluronan and proteoglycan link protein 3-like [Tachysurus vachellii]|uniref:hyaluronan and proteoglycan link protein 3-like n=1 Tax=Tachysurus vachellii TaxID=175792 RepID=UPI00296AE77D|nr:hyaluronan and proteoglycan link protein 3-like [Tachysurus vachellii]XP_060715298.1 hyaluronan and proteoglycan link protein 3-like [Tachysurus vachellii]
MGKLHTLLALTLQVLYSCYAAPSVSNGFFYQDILNGTGNGEIHFNGIKLRVASQPHSVFAVRGSKVTLPCRYWYEPPLISPRKVRVKWSLLPLSGDQESDVLVSIGHRQRSFGAFKDRVHLQKDDQGDISLIITNVSLKDSGLYRCEVIDGLEDESATLDLGLRGVVFPYQPHHGRYHLTFKEAQKACNDQDAAVATFDQLFAAWQGGLDWCNAGWLADGTVQYPIVQPRQPCGGLDLSPGVRSYGARHKHKNRYDVFCFTSTVTGQVYYLQHPQKLNLTMAVQACIEDGAQIAKVGQLFAAWKFLELDNCNAGWLADGSLRYPISKPRPNCGPQKSGVRSFGFPLTHHKHGVYCYRSR